MIKENEIDYDKLESHSLEISSAIHLKAEED